MNSRSLAWHLVLVAALAAIPTAHGLAASAKPTSRTPEARSMKRGHLEVRGIRYYYEVHGQGEPLLLLHGGLGSIDMFGPNLPILAEHRRVIAVDQQGHGRTTLGDRPIRYQDMADDMATLLEGLGEPVVDVLGYSMGAGIAFRLAVQHPDRVRRLAMVSGGFAQSGFHPELLPMQAAVGAAMAEQMKGTPMYESYMKVAPNPSDFPKLLDQMGAWMRTSFDWSDEVKHLKGPVMLVYGDSDMFRLEHVVEFYHLLGGGLRDAGWQREHMSKNRLAILPDLTHYEMFTTPDLARTVLPFLDGKSGARSWSEQLQEGDSP